MNGACIAWDRTSDCRVWGFFWRAAELALVTFLFLCSHSWPVSFLHFLFSIFSFTYFIYLKMREKDWEQGRRVPSTDSLPGCLQYLGLSKRPAARNSVSVSHMGVLEPTVLLNPRVHVNRKLDVEVGPRIKSSHSYRPYLLPGPRLLFKFLHGQCYFSEFFGILLTSSTNQ